MTDIKTRKMARESRSSRTICVLFCVAIILVSGCSFSSFVDETKETQKTTSGVETSKKTFNKDDKTANEPATGEQLETYTIAPDEQANQEAAKEASNKEAEEASREAVEAAERASHEAAEKASREAAEQASREAAAQASREAAGRASREAAERVSREAASRAATQAPTAPPRNITVTSGLTFRRNQFATLSINAYPGVTYYITVYYNSGPSKAEGLDPKVADGNGNVSWTWKIGGRTAPGTYRVIISGNGETIERSFTVITD